MLSRHETLTWGNVGGKKKKLIRTMLTLGIMQYVRVTSAQVGLVTAFAKMLQIIRVVISKHAGFQTQPARFSQVLKRQ